MNALAADDDGGPVQAVEFSWATQGGALESGVDDVTVDTDFDSPAPNLPPHLLTIIEADNAVVDHDEIIFEQRADGPIERAYPPVGTPAETDDPEIEAEQDLQLNEEGEVGEIQEAAAPAQVEAEPFQLADVLRPANADPPPTRYQTRSRTQPLTKEEWEQLRTQEHPRRSARVFNVSVKQALNNPQLQDAAT